MAKTSLPGPQHNHFIAWAKKQGIKINGVEPAKVPGRGLGIIAQRRIEVGEELVIVPASALLTTDSIPTDFRQKHKGTSVHALLASFLAFGGNKTSRYEAWKATWPSMHEFEESMPILWSAELREPFSYNGETSNCIGLDAEPAFLLPPAIGGRWHHIQDFGEPRGDIGHLPKQEKKLKTDWEKVSHIFTNESFDEYLYFWLIVNTRSFYFKLSGAEETAHEDCMVMCPVIDYFNHNDHGCDVIFDENGYTVISDRAYDVGEELQTSYGSHSNDFLLCEYGFILENNKFDHLPLDDFFSGKQINGNTKRSLVAAGYLSNYALSSEGVCFRTEVAIRRQILNTYNWKKFMAGTFEDDDRSSVQAASQLHNHILKPYHMEAVNALKHLERVGDTISVGVRDILTRRWTQIRTLILQAMEIHEIRRI